ncbi:MAG TPA: transcription termination/antitermination NusG family protein [Anaerolineales bacterium]|nr:transcription termination/antitermination NusG family protein [Anaerolineales bacterium]
MLGWYVMHSKPQKEQWLYNQLSSLQIETYFPCLYNRSGKVSSSKPKPYFPGYLFVNIDLDLAGRSALQWIPGSLGLVTFGDEPAAVPEGLLQRIRHRIDEINQRGKKILENLRPGDQVMIHSGPFAGYEAVFCTRLRDTERVQVLLKILQDCSLRINLSVNQLTITKQDRTLL